MPGRALLGPDDYPECPQLYTATKPDGFGDRRWLLDPVQPAIYIRPDLTPAQGRAAWAEAFAAYLASFDRPTLTVFGGGAA